jgi:hypothetical protein
LIGVFVPMNPVAHVLRSGAAEPDPQRPNGLFSDQIGSAIGAYDTGFPPGLLLGWLALLPGTRSR